MYSGSSTGQEREDPSMSKFVKIDELLIELVPLHHLRLIEQQVVNAAVEAAEEAYAPYSHFPVGAAVLATTPDDSDEETFSGCNVENASYGLTVCAERVTIFSCVSAGYTRISLLAVYCQKAPGQFGSPCGACRQVAREFAPNGDPNQMTVLVVWEWDDDHKKTVGRLTLQNLLPLSFGPSSLG